MTTRSMDVMTVTEKPLSLSSRMPRSVAPSAPGTPRM
jgi:hypothetical protein